VNIR